MQIACEKCATQYVLDENVIPPGGAPVQCTRCGHVFVATPEPKRTTQIFGSTRPAGEGAPQRSGTQVFGVAKPASDGAPEPSRTTQIFGKTSGPGRSAEHPDVRLGAERPASPSRRTAPRCSAR